MAHYARTTLLLLAAISLLALSACKKIDNKVLEDDITKDTATKGVKLASVTCPAGMPMREGVTFECTCTDTKGTAGTFDVMMANGHGRVEWKLHNKFMNMHIVGDSLESKLSKRFGQVVDVTCPSDNILIKQGVTFACAVKIGPKDDQITLTAKDDDGTDWDEKLTPK